MSNERSEEGQQTKWTPIEGEKRILYTFYVKDGCFPVSIPASKPIRTERGEVRADSLGSGEYGEIWAKIASDTEWRWYQVQRNEWITIDLSNPVAPIVDFPKKDGSR